MLHDQKLSKLFWEEETNTMVYVQNRVPSQALDNKTLEEVFIGVKLNISHLHILGYPIYFHVPKEKTNKLEATGLIHYDICGLMLIHSLSGDIYYITFIN